MSRTDKDAPWWVRSPWYKPCHYYCQYDMSFRFRSRLIDERNCDLPEDAVRHRYARIKDWRHPDAQRCTWEPIWLRLNRYRYTRPPTRKEKHLGWWGPDRRDVRDTMIKARKQYRGSGSVDVREPREHHRHCSKKGWWD